MGPLIHASAAQQMLDAQQQIQGAGGQVLVEMQRDQRSAALLRPGLIAVERDQATEDCEHFGPLLLVQQAATWMKRSRWQAAHSMVCQQDLLASVSRTFITSYIASERGS